MGQRRSHYLFFILILIACAIRLFVGYRSVYPIDPWDETFYIIQGLHKVPFQLDWGPLYAQFYRIYLFFTNDPRDIYFFNFIGQATLLSLMQFGVLARLGVRPFFSFLGGLAILLATFNLDSIPKINHFNTSYLYFCLIAASYLSDRMLAAFLMAILTLFGIYIRQDNMVLSLGCLAYSAYLCFSERKFALKSALKPVILCLGSYACVAMALFAFVGNPLTNSRTWNAFIDYFQWRDASRLLPPNSPPIPQAEFIRRIFGDAHSISGAFLANPREFAHHLFDNARALPKNFSYSFLERFSFFGGVTPVTTYGNLWIMLILICLVILARKKILAEFSKSFGSGSMPGLLILVTSVTLIRSLGLNFLLATYVRYFFEFVCLMWLFPPLVANAWASTLSKELPEKPCEIGALLLLIFLPTHLNPVLAQQFDEKRQVNRIVDFLKSHPIPEKPIYFALDAYPLYVNTPHAKQIHSWDFRGTTIDTPDTLSKYIDQNHVNVAVIDENIRFIITDKTGGSGLRDFEINYSKHGFKKVYSDKYNAAVYLREGY